MSDRLAQLAARHARVVTAAELDAAGFDGNGVRRLRRDGRLVRLFHGTYAVPPVEVGPFELACRGAARYAGAGAVIVGESALALMSAYPAPLAPEVAVPRERYVRATPGLVVRRLGAPWLTAPRAVGGVRAQQPATAVAWGWHRLRGDWDRRAVVCAAVASRVVTTDEIRAAAVRLPRVAARLELIATCGHVDEGCASPAEIAYLLDVERRFALPAGERQAVVAVPGGRVRRVDVRYGRVVVEIDGGHHATDPVQRADDGVRDVVLAALGFHVLRVTAADVRRAPGEVAVAVRAALAATS